MDPTDDLRRFRRTSGVTILIAALAVAFLASPAVALTPNNSILFYRPGTAVTGVLRDGLYTQKRTFSLRGVNLVAASRDTLALYTKATGRLRTGTFRGGIYTRVETIRIRSGFTHVAASCDSVLFYNRLSGRVLTGTLIGGRLRNRSSYLYASGYDRLIASCDTAQLSHAGQQRSQRGTLTGGDFVPTGYQAADSFIFGLQAANATSWISVGGNFGVWGAMGGGARTLTGDASSFSSWHLIAGTASSILFYNNDGTECRWRLASGQLLASACSGTFSAGWTLITGGR